MAHASSGVLATVLNIRICPRSFLRRHYPLQPPRFPRPRSLHPLLSSDRSTRFVPTGKRTMMTPDISWAPGDRSQDQATTPLGTTRHPQNLRQQRQAFHVLEVADRISIARILLQLVQCIRSHPHPHQRTDRPRLIHTNPTHPHLSPHPSQMPSDGLTLAFLLELWPHMPVESRKVL